MFCLFYKERDKNVLQDISRPAIKITHPLLPRGPRVCPRSSSDGIFRLIKFFPWRETGLKDSSRSQSSCIAKRIASTSPSSAKLTAGIHFLRETGSQIATNIAFEAVDRCLTRI